MQAVEDELFARFQRTSSPELLGQVYDQVAPELLHVALHLTGRPQAAEDALQATFLVALEKAADYDPARPLRPWLLGILSNQAKKLARSESRQVDPERLAEESARTAPPDPEADAEREELADRLDEALLALPPAYQPVLILRLRHGLDPVEIAHALRRPPGTVRAQLSRGLERLRRTLPASFAGAALFALVPKVRGLEAIREVIVSHAAAQLSWYATLGGISMYKLAIAGSVLASAILVPFAWNRMQEPRVSQEAAQPGELEPVAAQGALLVIPTDPGNRSKAPTTALESVALASSEPAAAEASIGYGSLRVTVRDENKIAPVADEWVIIEVFSKNAFYSDRLSARTDATGVAFFPTVPEGRAVARAIRGSQDGVGIRPGREAELDLDLIDGFEVIGEVVDSAGHPVADAEVWLSRRWIWNDGEVLQKADAMGRFHLTHVTKDHTIGARGQGWAPSYSQQPSAEDGGTAKVRLVLENKARLLHGIVVDSDGAPVLGADVLLGSEVDMMGKRLVDSSMSFTPSPLRARTDEVGRFSFEHAPFGESRLAVRRHGFAPSVILVDPARVTTDVVVSLGRGAVVKGSVVDDRGLPIPSVWIHTMPRNGFAGARTWSDQQGVFELRGLPAGEVDLVAELIARGSDEKTFALQTGEIQRWDIRLASPLGVHGVLLDAGGQPISDWTVAARLGQRTVTRSDPTSEQGEFFVEYLSDQPHSLLVDGKGGWREFPRALLENVPADSSPLTITVSNEGLGRIVADVVDFRGSPATDAKLMLWHFEKRIWRSFDVDSKTGHVEIERIPPGPIQVRIASEDSPWKGIEGVVARADKTEDLGTVRLERGFHLKGEISGLREDLYEGLVLTLADDKGQEAAGVEIHDNLFHSGALAPGRYLLTAMGRGVQMRSEYVHVSSNSAPHVSLRLEQAGIRKAVFHAPKEEFFKMNLRCQVKGGDGMPVWMGGGPFRSEELTIDVSALPGSYRIVGQTNNGIQFDEPFEILGLDDGGPPVRIELAN